MYLLNPYILKSSTLKDSLISCWEFDETSGLVGYDAHGSNNLTYPSTSISLNQTGKINKSVYVNSSSVNITTSNSPISSFPFSISLWYKSEFSQGEIHTSYLDKGVRIVIVDGGVIYVDYHSTSSYKRLYYNSNTSIGNWHHWVFTSSGISSSDTKFYVDGNELSFNSEVNSISSVNWGSGDFTFLTSIGFFDQSAIWGKVLNTTEISQIYNSGNGLVYSNW